MANTNQEVTPARLDPFRGPFLSTALIAEKVLVERDNVPTIVRVVDKIGIHPEAVKELKDTIGFDLVIMVAFRACGYQGELVAMLVQVCPSGESEPIGIAPLPFDGTATGICDVRLPLMLKWKGAGQYWFDIYLDNKLYSRIPFEIAIGTSPSEESSKQ